MKRKHRSDRPKQLLTVAETSRVVGIARQNVLKAIERQALKAGWQDGPYGRHHGRYLIALSDAIAYRQDIQARQRRVIDREV